MSDDDLIEETLELETQVSFEPPNGSGGGNISIYGEDPIERLGDLISQLDWRQAYALSQYLKRRYGINFYPNS